MSRRLRVFVASTMRDLANERDAVVKRLVRSNLEPVHAESFAPGSAPWPTICAEIASSDIFVLILGESYGFEPDTADMAGCGKSVTHLEYEEALELGLPILAFVKRLDYGTAAEPKRDGFRQTVGDWSAGKLTVEFDLASDLADRVLEAVVQLLTDEYLNRRVLSRFESVTRIVVESLGTREDRESPPLPGDLIEAVGNHRALLITGAGMSREAGYPGALFHQGVLTQRIRRHFPDYAPSSSEPTFRRVAEDLETVLGRDALVQAMRYYFWPSRIVAPAESHFRAVRLFPRIVTTNYSTLFEAVCRQTGDDRRCIDGPIDAGDVPDRGVVKIRGSIARPPSLVVTESDEARHTGRWVERFPFVVDWLREQMLVVVGSSLIDRGLKELLDAARPLVRGYHVVPRVHAPAMARIADWKLRPIPASASRFFASLESAVGS